MTTLLYGQLADPVPTDQVQVRSTTGPIQEDAPPAVADSAPDFNELETDNKSDLYGLSTRSVQSEYIAPERSAPGMMADQADYQHNAIIDRQIASAGVAPAKELTGAWGHGTLQIVRGIEPIIREGGDFGNDYAVRLPHIIQEGANKHALNPMVADVNPGIITAGAVNARAAYGGTGQLAAGDIDYGAVYSALTGVRGRDR